MTVTIEVTQHAPAVLLRIVTETAALPGDVAGAIEYDSWAAVFRRPTSSGESAD